MEGLKIDQEILLINVKSNPKFPELEPIDKRTFVTTGMWNWADDGTEDIWCGTDNIGILVDTKNGETATKGKIVGRFTVRRLHNNDPITII